MEFDEEKERLWSRRFQNLKDAFGVYGNPDSGGAQWFMPNGSHLCRTSEMPGSAETDFWTLYWSIYTMVPKL